MKIESIDRPAFKEYGKVICGLGVQELLEELRKTPVTDGGVYVAEDPNLQALPAMAEVSEHLYGGMPVQLGWCNGRNTKLNCLEYHRDSEVNLGTEDFILLLGRQSQIGEDGLFDTAQGKAFLVPAGVLVEVYATTLHYAPCSAKKGQGFQVLVALPQGTNTEKPDMIPQNREDRLLAARNKWLLAHPDSDEARGGAVIGLKGINIDIAEAIG